MTYEQAKGYAADLKARFDAPYSASDKALIERLYMAVLRRTFVKTTCQQCYHDAVVEIYLYLKNNKTMKEQCNYQLRAGFVISCPDFYGGKIFTNANLTDKVAEAYLDKYPKAEDYFAVMPSERLVENREKADGTPIADKGE